jgi:hypothetical protein
MSELPAGLRVLQRGGSGARGGGNLLLVDETPGREALLKIYRRRGTHWGEVTKWFSYRVLERKRGVGARERCALERSQLAVWRAEGFDVPALLARPLPEGLTPDTAVWMEWCPGPLLYDFVRDPAVPREMRAREVERFAAELSARQARAIASDQRALVMKHASIKHVILCGGRQVSFDLEGGHAPSLPLLDALADEVAAHLRSLLRVLPREEREAFATRFAAAYGRPEQLGSITDFGLRHGGLHRAVRRISDRRRRRDMSEYDALYFLDECLRREPRSRS